MDYVTRQFLNLIKKFRKELPKLAELLHRDLKQYTDAIHAAKKSSEDQRDIQPVWLEPILSKYQEPIRDKKASDARQYTVQNSLRWAAWFTFGAAFFYGGIAALQWWDYNKSIGISQIIARQSRIQASAAIVSIQQSKKSLELDQRAWVGLSYPESIPSSTSMMNGAIKHDLRLPTIRNTGKTPAKKASVVVGIAWTGADPAELFTKDDRWMKNIIDKTVGGFFKALPASKETPAQEQIRVIVNRISKPSRDKQRLNDPSFFPPHVSVDSGLVVPDMVSLGALSPSMDTSLDIAYFGESVGDTSALGSCIVYGRISYIDIWGDAHKTVFCSYTPELHKVKFRPCAAFNDIE